MANLENNLGIHHSPGGDGPDIYNHVAGKDRPSPFETEEAEKPLVFREEIERAVKGLKLPTVLESRVIEALNRLGTLTLNQAKEQLKTDVREEVRNEMYEEVRDEVREELRDGVEKEYELKREKEAEMLLDIFCRRILSFSLDEMSPMEQRETEEIMQGKYHPIK